MARKLPPLNALRAFEASARHLSFSRAADELGVTPAAISHQVRLLEDVLRVPLFRRVNRSVLLTDAGRSCLPLLSEGFDFLARAVAAAQADQDSGLLTVSIAPSFASKWLVPRIERFSNAHPEIDVRISASMTLVDFRSDKVDVAIRFGKGDYPGLRVDKLFAESISPMCSPTLMHGDRPLGVPTDLRHHTLIHDDSAYLFGPTPDWRMWLAAAGADSVDSSRGSRFSFADHALQAAIDGTGVVLGRNSLAAADIAAGRLIRPFDLSLSIAFGYYLVRPDVAVEPPKVAAFCEWVLAEAHRDETTNERNVAPAA